MGGDPDALSKEKREQPRRDPLRKIEMKAAHPAELEGHYDQSSQFQSKWLRR
jgi:hypothetical protein